MLEVRDLEGRPAAVLDRSAFYPEGGGQPGDRGTLGAVRVLDTQERDGAVLHLLESRIEPGPTAGEIDGRAASITCSSITASTCSPPPSRGSRRRRFPSISASAPAPSTWTRRRPAWTPRRPGALANESVWRNLPVVARDFTGEERARLPLRKEPVKGDRVVLVEGVDASPCGGTHPARTGECSTKPCRYGSAACSPATR